MKRPLLIIILVFVVIILTLVGMILHNNSINAAIQKENRVYEIYLGKNIMGTEVATLIGKVTEQNIRNEIPKNEKGIYIDNGENSIRIDIKMNTVDNTYPMETITDNNIVAFIQNFNFIEFTCTDIEYHKKTGKISRIIFEEIEEEIEIVEDIE